MRNSSYVTRFYTQLYVVFTALHSETLKLFVSAFSDLQSAPYLCQEEQLLPCGLPH